MRYYVQGARRLDEQDVRALIGEIEVMVVPNVPDQLWQEAMRRLAGVGIGCRPFFYPMHQQPVLRRLGLFENESYPVAERLYRQGFYIPSDMALTDQQIEQVAETVGRVLR